MVLREKYPFIHDDIFLIAEVNEDTGKQHLIIQKINKKTNKVELEDKIECIHTVVTTISPSEYIDFQNSEEFKEDLLNKTIKIQSSEKLSTINLSMNERFFALKSWVQGIAESNMNAFDVQTDIEDINELIEPIIMPIIQFLIKVDSNFIFQYLDYIERKCMLENTSHFMILEANIDIILESMSQMSEDEQVSILPRFLHSEDLRFIEEIQKQILEECGEKINILPIWDMDYKSIYDKQIGFSMKLGHITSLVLTKLGITSLPDTIGNLKSLKSLILKGNKLYNLPDSIKNLSSLAELDLRLNKFSIFPESILNLQNLNTLIISNNQLKIIPSQISNLESLNILRLDNNELTFLPDSIGNLHLLKSLNLNLNKLLKLPNSLNNLHSLKFLDILGNNKLFLSNEQKDFIRNLKENKCYVKEYI